MVKISHWRNRTGWVSNPRPLFLQTEALTTALPSQVLCIYDFVCVKDRIFYTNFEREVYGIWRTQRVWPIMHDVRIRPNRSRWRRGRRSARCRSAWSGLRSSICACVTLGATSLDDFALYGLHCAGVDVTLWSAWEGKCQGQVVEFIARWFRKGLMYWERRYRKVRRQVWLELIAWLFRGGLIYWERR